MGTMNAFTGKGLLQAQCLLILILLLSASILFVLTKHVFPFRSVGNVRICSISFNKNIIESIDITDGFSFYLLP